MQRFTATMIRPEGTGTWTYVNIPEDVSAALGTKARVAVRGTIDGVPYESSLMPQGGGRFILVVPQPIRAQLGKASGDEVLVTLERDETPRQVKVPDDFADALARHPEAEHEFGAFSYSHQKEYIDWIESAKKAETRVSRIEKALGMIAERRRLKG